jgi:hypothetical protein
VAAEAHRHRAAADDTVLLQIFQRECAPARPHVLHEPLAERATVEDTGTLLRDQVERGGQVIHHEAVARVEPVSLRPVDRLALGLGAQDEVEDGVQVGLARAQLDAVAGELRRRRDQLRPGQLPVAAVRGVEARERTRHRVRGGADAEHLRRAAACELDVHLFHRSGRLPGAKPEPRHGDEEVE